MAEISPNAIIFTLADSFAEKAYLQHIEIEKIYDQADETIGAGAGEKLRKIVHARIKSEMLSRGAYSELETFRQWSK